MLRNYKITLCLDNDQAGKTSLPVIGNALLSYGFKDVHYVRPPKQYKDWNQMLQENNEKLLAAYIVRKEKMYYEWTGDEMAYELIV